MAGTLQAIEKLFYGLCGMPMYGPKSGRRYRYNGCKEDGKRGR